MAVPDKYKDPRSVPFVCVHPGCGKSVMPPKRGPKPTPEMCAKHLKAHRLEQLRLARWEAKQ